MCGIAGIYNLRSEGTIDLDDVARMMGVMRYRGPDEAGVYLDDHVGLGHVRLSIIDLASGGQPIANEDRTLWIIYNGEVFNYVELRDELVAKGHRFSTTSDTEVILHLYEEDGPDCLCRLNGQFAFAIWNSRRRELFLARDRVGIRPLHYTMHDGKLIFGSEVKSIFSVPGVPRRISPEALDQVFTFWTPLPGQTIFEGISELPPGHYLVATQGRVRVERYWDIPICRRDGYIDESADALAEAIRALLLDAIRLRLRADVPVGCYLSGGLDSSGIAALTARHFNADLRTFGIRFDQEAFDEGTHQQRMAMYLGTRHCEVQASDAEIGSQFAEMLWHAEKPLLRTGPVPLFMLSRAVQDDGLKVVLTGEGADEVFGGYNIFKEAKVRQFWARQPDSAARAALTGRLYGYVFRDPRTKRFLKPFFASGLKDSEDPCFSHRLRWNNTSRIKTFYSDELKTEIGDSDVQEQMRGDLPNGYDQLDTVAKAQYLEMKLFLSNYLLSSQGDRVAMAHSVEIRVPFLDYRVIEFMARVPSRWKLLGLNEKYILKKALAVVLPDTVCQRRKQPYRAPIVHGLLSRNCLERAMERLSPAAIASAGLFAPGRVERLVEKVQAMPSPGEVDSMALAGILSSQIVHQQFVEAFSIRSIPVVEPDIIIDHRSRRRHDILGVGSHHRRAVRVPDTLHM